MAKTYAQQLEEVQTAIGKIEGGAQSYTIGEGGATRTVTRATLRDLYDREKFLRTMAAREEAGGIRINYGLPK
jgi:hypothetical protein